MARVNSALTQLLSRNERVAPTLVRIEPARACVVYSSRGPARADGSRHASKDQSKSAKQLLHHHHPPLSTLTTTATFRRTTTSSRPAT